MPQKCCTVKFRVNVLLQFCKMAEKRHEEILLNKTSPEASGSAFNLKINWTKLKRVLNDTYVIM
jgi:hypothetical protein